MLTVELQTNDFDYQYRAVDDFSETTFIACDPSRPNFPLLKKIKVNNLFPKNYETWTIVPSDDHFLFVLGSSVGHTDDQCLHTDAIYFKNKNISYYVRSR